MTVEDNFSLFGAGGLFTDGFFLGQLGVLALALLLFAGSLALCLMALRAASSARQAHGATLDLHASIERQSSQMQLLGADVERIAQDMAARQQEMTAQHHAVPQADQHAPQTGAESESNKEPVRRAFDRAEAEPEAESAIPKSLLRGLLRRR